jgi:hypothetical protein
LAKIDHKKTKLKKIKIRKNEKKNENLRLPGGVTG